MGPLQCLQHYGLKVLAFALYDVHCYLERCRITEELVNCFVKLKEKFAVSLAKAFHLQLTELADLIIRHKTSLLFNMLHYLLWDPVIMRIWPWICFAECAGILNEKQTVVVIVQPIFLVDSSKGHDNWLLFS